MVQTTQFDQRKWNLKTFDKIGYDHDEKRLYIFYLNGSIVEFSNIEEGMVFQFIVSINKESFVKDTFYRYFLNRVIYKEASLSC
ncbi:hypothetical protein N783_05930 [Pontibacillus marinus BH030004 = DSM 16465]|uniref:KTSC domain-containing protein n=1 Tax=Pontibacillus marinus BH030004 = DSM 16465 TaxID=1385511 RepID=A0A0A5FQV7_9BACI|nr:hypothetical protein N783_05930 [Pontibacillus marinus BH030004 = DSM 16465]